MSCLYQLAMMNHFVTAPLNTGYSFLMVLKQCGHPVTIFFYVITVQNLDIHHGLHLKIKIRCRLAWQGSPVQLSSVPKTA